ncbi:MAG: prepilin-type N-terminal cleavage/methylation domain-containing protein [Blastocatellia bacterium]
MRENKMSNRISNKGYSLLEILVVLILVSLGIIAVAVNIPASRAMIEPESVLAQTASFVLEAKKNALLGFVDVNKRTFNIEQIRNITNSVIISTTPATNGAKNCNLANCLGTSGSSDIPTKESSFSQNNNFSQTSQQLGAICISGQSFCFDTNSSFTFNRFSGRTNTNYIIFFSNKKRKLALIVTSTGDVLVAENTNNEWRSRTDLQQLLIEPIKTKKE